MSLLARAFILGACLAVNCCSAAEPSPEAAATPPDDGCAALSGGSFQLVEGQTNRPFAEVPKPDKGKPFPDPAYGACIVRATDHAHEPTPGFARNDYSRRQAFNADNSRMLVYARDGSWHLYDPAKQKYVGKLPYVGGDAEPQWHPVDPDLLYFVPPNGGLQLLQLNVRTSRMKTVGDYRARLPWPAAQHVWTKSEGSPSADARYWCFMVDDADWKSLGIFVWDLQTDKIVGTLDTNGNRPDHVSMSPSGRHCVVSWDAPDGTVSFSQTMARERQVHHGGEHSDLAIGAHGEDIYVSVDYQSRGGQIFMVDLDSGERTDLLPTYLARTATAVHFSGKAFNRPGWVVLSTYGAYNADGGPLRTQWLHAKVFLMQLKANPAVYSLAHHHSSGAGYWSEAQASASRDLTHIAFNSDWGQDKDDVDDYVITLPASALP
jgi:hypothetical protein